MKTTINPVVKHPEPGPESEHMTASMMIRGNVLHYFSISEALMDDIIRRTTFDTPEQYDEYMDLFQKGGMAMPVKKTLLRFCIDKVCAKYNVKLHGLEHMDDIATRRNSLAHYILDTSEEALQRFIDTKVLRFKGLDRKGRMDDVNFTWDSAKQFVYRIEAFTIALAAMQKIIIEGKSY